MKKWTAALLVAATCVSLCACGSSEAETKYEKYKTLIDALEAKDYEGAVMEIYAMYEADQENQGGDVSNETVEQTTTADANKEMWKEIIPGEWLAHSYEEEVELDNLEFHADGTCVINGESLNWEIEDAYETDVRVMAMKGETPAYRLYVNRQPDRDYYNASLSVIAEDGSSTGTNASYYRAADYTVLELTADNVMDYFEVVEKLTINKNSFGEVENADVSKYLVLKEEYGVVNSELSHVAVEYSAKSMRQMVTMDLEAKTYEMGDVVADYDPNSSTTEMGSRYLEDDVRRYGLDWGNFSVDEFPQDEVWNYTDYSIVRLLGTIYCTGK